MKIRNIEITKGIGNEKRKSVQKGFEIGEVDLIQSGRCKVYFVEPENPESVYDYGNVAIVRPADYLDFEKQDIIEPRNLFDPFIGNYIYTDDIEWIQKISEEDFYELLSINENFRYVQWLMDASIKYSNADDHILQQELLALCKKMWSRCLEILA